MTSYTELMYWYDYRNLIYYDEASDTYTYDPKIPERAKKSHIEWLKHIND